MSLQNAAFSPLHGVMHLPGKPVKQVFRQPIFFPFGNIDIGTHHFFDVDGVMSMHAILRHAKAGWKQAHCRRHNGRFCVMVDIGHGQFDQHSGWIWNPEDQNYVYYKHPKEEGYSSIALVMESLFGHQEWPANAIVDYVDTSDREGYRGNRDEPRNRQLLDPVFKSMLDYTAPERHHEVLRLILMAFDQTCYTYQDAPKLEDEMVDVLHLADLMHRAPAPKDVRTVPWVAAGDFKRAVRNAINRRQRDFDTAKALISQLEKQPSHVFKFHDGQFERRIIRATSDNRAIGSASRHLGFDAILKSTPNTAKIHPGSYQLFANTNDSHCKDGRLPVDLLPFAVNLRLQTHRRKGISSALENPHRFFWSGATAPDDGVYVFVPATKRKAGPATAAVFCGSKTQGPEEFIPPVIDASTAWKLAKHCLKHADKPEVYPEEVRETEFYQKKVLQTVA